MDLGPGGNAVGSSIAEVFAEPDGTVVLRFVPGARLTEERTAEVIAAHVAAAAGQKRRTLADVRGLSASDRGSRELAAGPEIVAVTSRMAILVGSPVSRVLGNFFLRVTSPAYPTRIFSDEGAARRWLQESTP